jgi:alpha/beta hydrolase fold
MRPYTLRVFALCLLNASMLLPQNTDADDGYVLFEQPGRMVKVSHCHNSVFTAQAQVYRRLCWNQALVAEPMMSGTCFSRGLVRLLAPAHMIAQGYGFSQLGADLPRNMQHDVLDLHALLKASGERGPYILVGHSDGGHIIGAYADSYPKEVAALIFLDAAVLLDKEQISWAPGDAQPRNTALLQLEARGDTRMPEAC